MTRTCERHDAVYYGCLNVYEGELLLKVIESWRCRRCGSIRVGVRWFDEISSTEGLHDFLSPEDGRWLVLVTKSPHPDARPFVGRPGSVIEHAGVEYVVGEDYTVRRADEGGLPTSVAFFRLDEVIKGYIDLSTWPPTKLSLKTTQG
ncbi:MAG: hypothetical protein NZ920_03290 [Aigarchaeota archaeon]|nr:hypothetical protein [Aigarchaeota archaeon]MDW8092357.1 hypothetical protein [Nitrososphaerota archaeon]